MKVPNYKRIYKNDFQPEEQSLVEKLAISINNGIEVLYDLANKKISLRDNVLCSVKDFTVQVDSTGAPTTTTFVGLDGNNRVDGVQVIRAENSTDSSTYPTNHPFISYQQQGSTILINNVSGLQTGSQWKLRVIIWQV